MLSAFLPKKGPMNRATTTDLFSYNQGSQPRGMPDSGLSSHCESESGGGNLIVLPESDCLPGAVCLLSLNGRGFTLWSTCYLFHRVRVITELTAISWRKNSLPLKRTEACQGRQIT